MSKDTSTVVSKVWSYAHVLKNAGVAYGDYIETELDQQLARSNKLRQSILTSAFAGNLA